MGEALTLPPFTIMADISKLQTHEEKGKFLETNKKVSNWGGYNKEMLSYTKEYTSKRREEMKREDASNIEAKANDVTDHILHTTGRVKTFSMSADNYREIFGHD